MKGIDTRALQIRFPSASPLVKKTKQFPNQLANYHLLFFFCTETNFKLMFWFTSVLGTIWYFLLFWCIYSYFEKGCRKKKTSKVHATRPKGGLGIHWNFAYWPRGNLQVCIFARGGFVFPLRRPISVALLLLSHVFE